MNWISEYSTTWMKLPHGSRKSLPFPNSSTPASRAAASAASLVVDDEAEVPVVVGSLRAAFGQREELVAHADERHPRDARLHLDVEDAPVELERLVEVADLEGDMVDSDQPRLRHLPIVPASQLATTGG